MVDHWQCPVKISVLPLLKSHSLSAWCQGGKVAAWRTKCNVCFYKLRWIFPKVRGIGQYFHIVSVVCLSSSTGSFDTVCSSSFCGTPSFMTVSQMRLSIFFMPFDCWKDIMRAIFWFPPTVSQIDGNVQI